MPWLVIHVCNHSFLTKPYFGHTFLAAWRLLNICLFVYPAAALLTKGLTVASEVNDDSYSCVMSYQKAASLLLGGSGEEFDAEELQQLLHQGEAMRESVLSWFPELWRPVAVDGEPDRTLVLEKLVPEWEKRNEGRGLREVKGKVGALQGLLYVTKAPSSIPPGAVRQLEEAGQGHLAAEEGVAA